MDLQGMECGGMDWIEVAQDRDMWREHTSTVLPQNTFLASVKNFDGGLLASSCLSVPPSGRLHEKLGSPPGQIS
jgi:hypothetical protein